MPRKKTGGRQKGAVGKATAEAYAAAKAGGIMPLDYMLEVMRDTTADARRRDAMASAAAPYLHKKQGVDEQPMSVAVAGQISSIQVSFVKPNHKDDEDA